MKITFSMLKNEVNFKKNEKEVIGKNATKL